MKKIDTIKKDIQRFRADWAEFDGRVAWARLYRDLPLGDWNKRNDFYNRQIERYLDAHYGAFVQKLVADYDASKMVPVEKPTIWVMWWQGEEAMPPIIQICYENLMKTFAQYKIVLITEKNYKDYICLPNEILEKFQKGKMTITQFSDIARAYLLSNYGGLWVDATIYFHAFPEGLFEGNFYTLRGPGMFSDFLSTGKWIPGFLYVSKTNTLFATCVLALFEKYWAEHDTLIEYLLVDFFIFLLRKYYPDTIRFMEDCPLNRNFYDLNLSINEIYDAQRYEAMMQKSPIQILRFRKPTFAVTEDGHLTNYGHLVEMRENA